MTGQIAGAVVYGMIMGGLIIGVGYRLASGAVFKTAGHTSSEFKLIVAMWVAACIHWVLGAIRGSTAGIGESWIALAIATAAYALTRAIVKCGRGD